MTATRQRRRRGWCCSDCWSAAGPADDPAPPPPILRFWDPITLVPVTSGSFRGAGEFGQQGADLLGLVAEHDDVHAPVEVERVGAVGCGRVGVAVPDRADPGGGDVAVLDHAA